MIHGRAVAHAGDCHDCACRVEKASRCRQESYCRPGTHERNSTLTVSSRTPEGWPNTCPVCRLAVDIEPSIGTQDAVCPGCGHLLWCAQPADEEPDLTYFSDDFVIPPQTIEIITESIARENSVLAVGFEADHAIIASPVRIDFETREKLVFILGRGLIFIAVCEHWFQEQFSRAYGRTSSGD